MDNPIYATLSRQVGLDRAMRVVANNLANLSTTGFRREGVVFGEWIDRLAVDGGALAQTEALVRVTDFGQGVLRATGGDFDLGIEGDGFFMVETPSGPALTRAGAFVRSSTGEIVTPDGARLLDAGAAPIVAPPGVSRITIAADGAMSGDGRPLAQIAVVSVPDNTALTRIANGRFKFDGPLAPATDATIFQGSLEQSNVNPVRELTRMIEIQRAYEAGQSLLQSEDERMRQASRLLTGN